MENKVGLYRMLIDASCAIFQNLSALSSLMDDEALKSAKKSLREIVACSDVSLHHAYADLFKDMN